MGIRKECSREPCERTRGRKDEEERGVETPVCGPVEVPYMVEDPVVVKGLSLPGVLSDADCNRQGESRIGHKPCSATPQTQLRAGAPV